MIKYLAENIQAGPRARRNPEDKSMPAKKDSRGGFRTAFRGYDREEVNRFIEENDLKNAASLRRFEEERKALEEEYSSVLSKAEQKIHSLEEELSSEREKLSVVKSCAESERLKTENRIRETEEKLAEVEANVEGLKKRISELSAENENLRKRLLDIASENIVLQNRLREKSEGRPRQEGQTPVSRLRKIVGDLFDVSDGK